MNSLLNRSRPPVFCPGCSHEHVVHALDSALQSLNLQGNRVAIVSDIGCSGLFDTFFETHALHGLHGRALTYATGIKLARPELTVIAVMGDGGIGIGGAHVLSACRRNLDLTLLVLNNFNYGMTGGQCSATTPASAQTASTFLSQLEIPLDICQLATAAGAPFAIRVEATNKELALPIEKAIAHEGFSVVDIWGLCPGRYLKRNRLSLKQLEKELTSKPGGDGPIDHNKRDEFGVHYRKMAKLQSKPTPQRPIPPQYQPTFSGRREVLILGSAGQRINTACEILCLSALTAGLYATQKNDYPITVLRGHSIGEVVLSNRPIDYTGLYGADVVIALSSAGIQRRKELFPTLDHKATVISVNSLDIPETPARIIHLDLKARSIPTAQCALATLAFMAHTKMLLTTDMLNYAIDHRFEDGQKDQALSLLQSMKP